MASNYSASFAFGQTSQKRGATTADITYLPKCTSSHVGTYAGYSLSRAADFDPRHWDYYKGLLPAAIGGWVVAGLCLVCAVVFVIWLCAVCACSCCGKARKRVEATTFKDDPYTVQSPSRLRRFSVRHGTCSIVLCALSVLLLLATLALGAWGLYEGLHATKDLSTDVFAIVDMARIKVVNLQRGAAQFFDAVRGVQAALYSLGIVLDGQDLGRLQGRLNTPLNLTGLGTSEVTSAVRSAGNTLGDVGAAGGTIAYNIQRYGVRSLTDVLKKQGTFDDVQNKWVPLFLGLMFGVLALLAILATVLLVLHRVRAGSTFLFLLWLWTALWFFTGPGLLKFGTDFTSDVCVYPERFAFTYVNGSNIALDTKASVRTGLQYYFGAFGPNVALDDVIKQVYGLDITSINVITNSTIVKDTVDSLVSTTSKAILGVGSRLNSTQRAALDAAPAQLADLQAGYSSLQQQMSRSNFDDLYADAKTLLCCTLANRVRYAWIAWTCAAAMAGLLCAVLTVRAVEASRRYLRRPKPEQFIVGADSHGMLPAAPPPLYDVSSNGHKQQGDVPLTQNMAPSHPATDSPQSSWRKGQPSTSEIEAAPPLNGGGSYSQNGFRNPPHGAANGASYKPAWPSSGH